MASGKVLLCSAMELAPVLLEMYKNVFETGSLPSLLMESVIAVILKSGKNPMDCKSFRPISLHRCDVNVSSKVLSNRTDKVIIPWSILIRWAFSPNASTLIIKDYNLFYHHIVALWIESLGAKRFPPLLKDLPAALADWVQTSFMLWWKLIVTGWRIITLPPGGV